MYLLGIFLVSISWIWSTVVNVTVRILNKHVHFSLSPFWISVTTVVQSIVIMWFKPSLFNFSHYTVISVFIMCSSGIFGFLSQSFKSLALKYGEASVMSPFGYLQVVYLFIWDLLIFHYSFNSTDIIGAALITLCLFGPVLYSIYSWKKSYK